jgi:GT2 family glycosyltransferase
LIELSVLIVNYNAASHLENCLDSLFAHTQHRPLEVIVVDNASSDGSLDMLGRKFSEVRVVSLPENIGFARANNIAMREAQGRFFLLLNNDTLVERGAIETMLRIMREKPEIGALGPLLRNEDGSVQISYGRMISFHAEIQQKLLNQRYEAGGRLVRRYVQKRSEREAYPDWVSGASLMLRSEILAQTGFFDESIFMYTEDVDLCHRVRKAGYRVCYTPEAEIVHLGGKSRETLSEKVELEYRRSQLHFYSKHYGRGKVRLLKVYLLTKLVLGWALKGPTQRSLYRRLIGLVWNY